VAGNPCLDPVEIGAEQGVRPDAFGASNREFLDPGERAEQAAALSRARVGCRREVLDAVEVGLDRMGGHEVARVSGRVEVAPCPRSELRH